MTEKTVLLVMYRRMLSDWLTNQTGGNIHFKVVAVDNYALAPLTAETCMPDLALVEIPESGQWQSAEKCLTMCDLIRTQIPNCKQMILCDDKDAASCQAAIQARKEQRIDDFLFFSNSTKYLVSKLEALV